LLKRRYGARKAYLGGFIFYWAFWCLVIPLILLGPQQVIRLFHPVSQPFGQPWLLGLLCLLGPPLVSLAFIFPRQLAGASQRLLLISALLALVNGVLEELLWRGVYMTLFPDNPWLAIVYPAIGFAIWHFAPQSIYPYDGPGGRVVLVAGAALLGLLWGWAAASTGVILYTALAHILVDFSALGWREVLQEAPGSLRPPA
jgi:membrane protease YdiL (CAAX protease family)